MTDPFMKNVTDINQPAAGCGGRSSSGPGILQGLASLILAGGVLLGAGCGKSGEATSSASGSASGSSSGSTVAPIASAPIVAPGAELPGTPAGPADEAWKAIQAAFSSPPMPPESWQTKPPEAAEIEAFKLKRGEAITKIADLMGDFYAKFGKDARAEAARLKERQLLDMAIRMGKTNLLERLEKLEQARLKDATAPVEERFAIKAAGAERVAQALSKTDPKAAQASMMASAKKLMDEFPDQPDAYRLAFQVSMAGEKEDRAALLESIKKLIAKSPSQPDPYQMAYGLILAGPKESLQPNLQWLVGATNAPEQIHEFAKATLGQLAFLDKPLDLKFTALDGQEVDLAKLKGKVVLLDFWATWCEPCLQALPELKEIYGKYHAKGLEVLGISLDAKKAELTRFLKDEEIAWPQSFDGKNPVNEIAERLGIGPIPTMWLIDAKGLVRDTVATEDLETKVTALLAEAAAAPTK